MARNGDVPKLLEQFMEESGEKQRWVTVNEFRTYFHLDECSAPAISGFLKRIYQGPFFSCPYRVERIEKVTIHTPQRRTINRYLVTRRLASRKKSTSGTMPRPTAAKNHDVFTDSGAIEIFDRVLRGPDDGNQRPGNP